MKEKIIYTCPLELTQKILSKKWTVIILWLLRHGKVRIKDFKNQIKDSNEKMIIEHLNYYSVSRNLLSQVNLLF